MQITNDQVINAARAGAELLASADVRVPGAKMGELILLREILSAVAGGHLIIGCANGEKLPKPPKPPSAKANGSEKTRASAKR